MRPGRRLVGAVLALLVATACSSAPPAHPTTMLRVLMTDDWVTEPFLGAVRSFEQEHPDVRVVVDKGPISLLSDAVRAGTGSGAPFDVVQGHAFSAAGQGLAQPLDDLWATALDPNDFFPGAVEDVTWAGHRYGVPLDTNALVLMYNAELFRQAGVPPPSPTMTFADFEALAKALTSPDGRRKGFVVPNSTWWTYGWIKSDGGETVDVGPDGKPTLTFAAPEVVQTVSFLAGLVDKGYAYAPTVTDSHAGDAVALFGSGAVAMYASGSWDLTTLHKLVPGGDFRAALMPRGTATTPEGSALGGSSMWVPTKSTHRELAFEFMTHVISDDTALRLAKEEGRLPARIRVFDDPYFADPNLQVFLQQLKTAHPPKLGAFDEPSSEFSDALDAIFRVGGADPRATLQQAQQRAVAALSP